MLTFGGAAIGLLFRTLRSGGCNKKGMNQIIYFMKKCTLTEGFLFLDGSSGGFDTGEELR